MDEVGSYTLNMIPEQGAVTVRVEEAMMATLAILNLAANSSTQR
jgi:predicted SPOUT superfamily RNA methylase MTH1